MVWDKTWEGVHSQRFWGGYPNEEFIRFMARNYYKSADRSAVTVLEIGCGSGANMWYLGREGFTAMGIDGSSSAIENANKYLAAEKVPGKCVIGDVANLEGVIGRKRYDIVADIGCIQCNTLSDAKKIVHEAYEVLKPGGKIFSLLLSNGSWGEGSGNEVEKSTYEDISEGPLVGTGLNRFYSRTDVDELMSKFSNLNVEQVSRSFEGCTKHYKTWVITACRKA